MVRLVWNHEGCTFGFTKSKAKSNVLYERLLVYDYPNVAILFDLPLESFTKKEVCLDREFYLEFI